MAGFRYWCGKALLVVWWVDYLTIDDGRGGRKWGGDQKAFTALWHQIAEWAPLLS